jgi:FKBP-type peptidyl-prolyl cis-trans isomerase 2
MILKGLDDALEGIEVGKEKTVKIAAKDGFGERDPKLIQLVPVW